MQNVSAGLKHFNYIDSRKVKNLFKGKPFEIKIKNVKVNVQIRGCNGFLVNTETGKICYIDTTPFFDGGIGSGLFGNKNKAIMMRTAENLKDYRGGINQFISMENIIQTAENLTGGH